jgi:hypothetical protein
VVRPGHWLRDRAEQVTPVSEVTLTPTNISLVTGETLVRLHFTYQLLGQAPAGDVVAQFHPAVIGVVLLPFEAFPPTFSTEGPYQSPEQSFGEDWLWWEGFGYEHWQPVSSDPRWRAPYAGPYRDVKAQRIAPTLSDGTARLWFWYQQPDGIDWEVAAYFSASAFVLDAPL